MSSFQVESNEICSYLFIELLQKNLNVLFQMICFDTRWKRCRYNHRIDEGLLILLCNRKGTVCGLCTIRFFGRIEINLNRWNREKLGVVKDVEHDGNWLAAIFIFALRWKRSVKTPSFFFCFFFNKTFWQKDCRVGHVLCHNGEVLFTGASHKLQAFIWRGYKERCGRNCWTICQADQLNRSRKLTPREKDRLCCAIVE